MGMIRVSDDIERRLKEVADGRSMNSVIEKMLAYCSSPDGFCPTPQADTSYEPYLLERINERFDELKSLIEDTTVDRVAGRKDPMDPVLKQALARQDLDWEPVQELIYEFLEEKAPEWLPGSYAGVRQMEDTPVCYIKDDVLYFENEITGSYHPVLRVSPRVRQFLDTHTAS